MSTTAAAPRVAVVDDDPSVRVATGSLLRSAGYAVALFESADALLRDAAASFACVVADIHMPGTSGLALADRLRGTVPVILITGRTERALDGEAESAGALALFRKPYDGDALLDAVTRALRPAT